MRTQVHTHKYTQTTHLSYLVYLPDNYEETSDSFPLILFLHGRGERGNQLDNVKKEGLPQKLESGYNIPAIVIAPQCPLDTKWEYHLEALKQLIDQTLQEFRIDKVRIYCTGLSMGGAGTWSLATQYPDQFAAIIPICGRARNELNYPARLERIKNLPAWYFHGDADEIVPLSDGMYLIENLQNYGGTPKLTIYEGVDHDSWTQTYNNPEIYDWLLSHRRDIKE